MLINIIDLIRTIMTFKFCYMLPLNITFDIDGLVYYLSVDSIDRSEINDREAFNVTTPEFLNCLRISGLPNHKVTLKIGTPIMVLRNLDQFVTRLIVTRLSSRVLEANIMSRKILLT